jgi:hypothetical protein
MSRTRIAILTFVLAACGSKNNALDVDAGPSDASIVCATFGQACTGNGDCCSMTCDLTNHTCAPNPTMCSAGGSSCANGTDCCSGSCVGNVCSASQCVSDNQTCGSDGECCSGMCSSSKTCTPLNPVCKTSGNTCAAGTDCCSGLCDASSHTCTDSSYCVQNGDACAHDSECCGGICNAANGGIGTCSQPMPGSTNCQAGIDGALCNGCGDCCSRLCAPYGPTGVKVCQPAEGCRIDGDLCQKDSDCCGAAGSGLPGDGNVTCLRQNPTDPVGICRNPLSCDPQGDVCHFKDYTTCDNSSARNNCCAGTGNSGVCQLDPLGVPRCNGLGTTCRNMGDTCSSSADCCNGAPCVPDASGTLRCGATGCVNMGGTCSSTADCCNGATCSFPPGSTMGTCGTTNTCQALGQSCSDTNPCCTGTDCQVSGSDPPTACPAGQTTGCVCQTTVF